MARRRRADSAVLRLGRRVRVLRDERGWTQEQLAARAELDRSYLAGIEVGGRNPSVTLLERLARALDVSLAELFTWD